MTEILVLLATYLVAAIPFGYLLGRAGGIDVRRVGSGNIGATNVMRARGRWVGVLTLLLDAAKGAAGVLAARALFPPDHWVPLAAACVAVVAHCYPVYLGFRGGKGVATGAGAFLALSPLAALGSLALFGVVVGTSRLVSLASVAAAASFPLLAWLLDGRRLALGGLAVALVVLWRHRENLRRLAAGSEERLGSRARTPEEMP
jgi:glycerol-3-phosphate acyltransferase PlsY